MFVAHMQSDWGGKFIITSTYSWLHSKDAIHTILPWYIEFKEIIYYPSYQQLYIVCVKKPPTLTCLWLAKILQVKKLKAVREHIQQTKFSWVIMQRLRSRSQRVRVTMTIKQLSLHIARVCRLSPFFILVAIQPLINSTLLVNKNEFLRSEIS